jgi:outer membrane protein TolC
MKKYLAFIFLLFLLVPGCASFGWNPLTREKAAAEFEDDLSTKTGRVLQNRSTLDYAGCAAIALENNLSLRVNTIEARIARLEKKIAFANFLPALQAEHTTVTWDRPVMNQIVGPFYTEIHDQTMRQSVIRAEMPVFAPATWYAWAMRRRGEEIRDLIVEYARQMILLQTAAQYYHCLSLDAAREALSSQERAARTLRRELAALRAEGLVMASHVAKADALLLSRETALELNARARKQAGSELLAGMGLSPMGEIRLKASQPFELDTASEADLAAEALLHNPLLHIEDRRVAIEKENLKLALSAFLPVLGAFTSFNYDSNSLTRYPEYWMSGFTGAMTVFNGFANINNYRAAREKKKKALIEREEKCLTILLQTLEAARRVEDAEAALALRRKLLEAALAEQGETEARWEEGLIQASERLSALAEADNARMEVIKAEYMRQVSIAALMNVLGSDFPGIEEKDHEETH